MNTTLHITRHGFAHRWMTAVARAAALGLTLSLSGCGGSGGGGGSAAGGAASMNRAVSAFDNQEYSEAHDQATVLMNRTTGLQREEAAYLAGMSSYQLGNYSAADSELSIAAVSSDAETAGGAKAMLGQLRLDQRRPREAAGHFADASNLLAGEDARQAAWHAGLAFRQAGDEASAKRWLDTASSSRFDQASGGSTISNSTVASASSTASARPSAVVGSPASSAKPASSSSTSSSSATGDAAPATVGFTLQVGAFSDRARAKKAAEEADALSKKQNLGRVRVLPRRDAHGQPMYLVQVGWWVTRSEAADARARAGRLEYIVAPAAPLT